MSDAVAGRTSATSTIDSMVRSATVGFAGYLVAIATTFTLMFALIVDIIG